MAIFRSLIWNSNFPDSDVGSSPGDNGMKDYSLRYWDEGGMTILESEDG